MRYLLSFLLLVGFGFSQDTSKDGGKACEEKRIEVKKEVKDGKVLFKITKDGKTEEFEANLDDEEALAKIEEKFESDMDDDNVKIKVLKKTFEHDCKKENCDPEKCKHAMKGECKKDAMFLHMKHEDGDKKIKIIKKYKMDDELLLIDEKSGFLGVQIQDLSDQLSDKFKVKVGAGVLVSEVVEDSPAEKAGLKEGDIITKVDAKKIKNAGDLTTTIRGYEPESKVSVSVIRDGKKKKLKATLGKAENSFIYKFGDLGEMDKKHKQLLKMHPEGLEDFNFHSFPFDQDELKEQMEEMRQELKILKEDLKKLKENK